MNIQGAKLLSVSQSSTKVEGGARHLIDNGSAPDGFGDALMGQFEQLSESKDQGESTTQKPNEKDEKDEKDDLKATLDTLTDSLMYTSSETGEEFIVNNPTHGTGNEKALQFVGNPLPEEFELNSSGGRGSAFSQLAKEEQSFNLNDFGKAFQLERSARNEVQPAISDVDKFLSRGATEIAQLNRQPADNRIDVPAMSRPLGHPDWNNELGERIVWMNNRAMPSAEIKLNPLHLGPISVRIDMNNDQTTVAFTAQHAAVRDALEASIPKLREMMSEQQLNLAAINVSQHNATDQRQSQSQRFSQNAESLGQGAGDIIDIGEEVENGRAVVTKGLLSIYA